MKDKIEQLLESKKYAPLNESEAHFMGSILENTLNENTLSGDIAQFTPIMMPLVRKVYPALVANELLGLQPLKTPTGFIYALRNRYTGDKNQPIMPHKAGQIIVLKDAKAGIVQGDEVKQNLSGEIVGKVVHVERDNKTVLISVETDAAIFVNGAATIKGDAVEIVAFYTNESTFSKILKDYTGSHTTQAGELLGKDIKEVGITIERKAVEAKTRKLRGSYTLEMYEDLKNQHGLEADQELLSLMKAELQTEIDKEVIEFVNNNATIVPNTQIIPSTADGRWEVEKYRVEAIRIASECRQVGIDTKRGAANVILCSPRTVTMLEQLGSFKSSPYETDVKGDEAFRGIAGTFDGKKVIVDNYATDDYATVLYKGADRRDAMGFMSVYVPVEFQRVTESVSGQPAIIMRTRYALDVHPLDAFKYARSFGIDFKNTALTRR